MNGISILLTIVVLTTSKIIELPEVNQSPKEVKQQGKLKYFLEDSTNEYLTYRSFPTESSFITSKYYQQQHSNNNKNDSLIHINETNSTYLFKPTINNQELIEIKFDSFNYIIENIPISGCMRKTNSSSSITLVRSIGIGIFYFPNDLFIGGNYYLLATSLDFGLNGINLVGYNSFTITCRSDINGIIQMFKNVKLLNIKSKFRKIIIDKKKKKFMILERWKQILGNLKRKELGVLMFDLNMNQELSYCESRKEYLQCNVIH